MVASAKTKAIHFRPEADPDLQGGDQVALRYVLVNRLGDEKTETRRYVGAHPPGAARQT